MARERIVISSPFTAYKVLPKEHRDVLRPSNIIDLSGMPPREAKRTMASTKKELRISGYGITDLTRQFTSRKRRR